MSRKTIEPQQDDEEERTTALGFFNFAESYFRAAEALENANVKSTHSSSPIYFLYYHAIELYLKSFLRLNDHTAKELRSRKFGHETSRLSERAKKLGLVFDDEDMDVLSMMANTDAVIRSRYIQTGYFSWPSTEALNRTCKSLRASVGQALKEAKLPVRI